MNITSLSRKLIKAGSNRGIAVIYLVVLLFALVAFVALAIDLGYMYVSKTKLQNAADAAALAGAARLNGSIFTNQTGARLEAQRFALVNKAANDNVYIDTNYTNINSVNNSYDGDVVLGFWDGTICNPTIPTGEKVDCVKVTARRTNQLLPGISSQNKPVQTFFGRAIKIAQVNVSSTATAVKIPANIIPIAVNEYWLQKDASKRPYDNNVHLYPSSFVRSTNVDGSTSLAFGKIFGILGSEANDNMPSGSVGSKNMNGYVHLDARSSQHDGAGGTWYQVITGTSTVTSCSNCTSGFVGPVSWNSGFVSSDKFDSNFTYLLNGYPDNQIYPTAVKEQLRDPLSTYPQTSNYLIPTSSCPFATLAYFSQSGNQPLSKKDASGKEFKDVYPPGSKVVTMVYDGSFKNDSDPSMPNCVTNVGYVLLQIDGYGTTNPKNLDLDKSPNKLSDDGSTAYAHALSNIVEPSSNFGTCDQSFFDAVNQLRFLGGKVKLVK